jgi:4'-phosphopantetheinyl transferase
VRLRWLSIEVIDPRDLGRWRGLLDEHERERADRLRFTADREAFIAAHALLRAMLGDAAGQRPAEWRFVTDPLGKPRLAPNGAGRGLFFNLAHARGCVACVLARDEVGVDVELADRDADLAIAHRSFAPLEVDAIRLAAPERRGEVFLRLWTLKEAFIKATGEGLRRDLASFAFSLDPVRLTLRPSGTDAGVEAPEWRSFEWRPHPDFFLALVARQDSDDPLIIDARAARPDEITRWIAGDGGTA